MYWNKRWVDFCPILAIIKSLVWLEVVQIHFKWSQVTTVENSCFNLLPLHSSMDGMQYFHPRCLQMIDPKLETPQVLGFFPPEVSLRQPLFKIKLTIYWKCIIFNIFIIYTNFCITPFFLQSTLLGIKAVNKQKYHYPIATWCCRCTAQSIWNVCLTKMLI